MLNNLKNPVGPIRFELQPQIRKIYFSNLRGHSINPITSLTKLNLLVNTLHWSFKAETMDTGIGMFGFTMKMTFWMLLLSIQVSQISFQLILMQLAWEQNILFDQAQCPHHVPSTGRELARTILLRRQLQTNMDAKYV